MLHHLTRPFSGWKQFRQLRLILRPRDWRQLWFLFGAVLLVTGLQVVGIASILPFMKLVSQPGVVESNEWMRWAYEFFEFETEQRMLVWTGALVFILFSTTAVASALLRWLIQRTIWGTTHRLCVRQLQVYMELPYEFFLTQSSTELLRRIVADINRLMSHVLFAGSQLMAHATLAAGMLTLMFFFNAGITLAAMALFGGTYAVIHIFRHSYLVKLGQERIDADKFRFTAFTDAVTGMKPIRVANAAEYFVDRFDRASLVYSRLYPRLDLLTTLPRYLMEIVAFGGILLLVVAIVSAGGNFVELLPTLTLFALATYRLMPALHIIFASAAELSSSAPVISAIARELAPPIPANEASVWQAPARVPEFDPTSRPGAQTLSFDEEIVLHALCFQYTTAKNATLDHVDVRFPKGSRTALVGATGAGKTTLVDVAVGLLLPTEGSLRIDNRAICRDNVALWRQHIAYVPQDVFLYDASVADNITFGSRPVDMGRVREAARIAQIDAFVTNDLDRGYETRVGERGVRLSGGQRQRVGIARALYRKPSVLLLDEATSALDSVTEAAVMSAMNEAFPDITLIMVAHRLSTVRLCDRILLLSAGRVVAQGSYDDLYSRNNRFRQLVEAARDQDATSPA